MYCEFDCVWPLIDICFVKFTAGYISVIKQCITFSSSLLHRHIEISDVTFSQFSEHRKFTLSCRPANHNLAIFSFFLHYVQKDMTSTGLHGLKTESARGNNFF
ncbi:hypothetical protein GDO86_005764 [Hymenochirus boettgeri]|uniref:Uncharacterized protein n=1 Tax=Hymenochirus boettgeri TaxID=247094 RepID=A0A8T2JAS7_9PIPI|nr:hypothetical protein GDO86_005764 [Hymenochirus boettgeri]